MSILSSNHPVENPVSNSISHFLSDFQVIRIFRACGCAKAKGISIDFLFAYIFGNEYKKGFRLLTLGWTDGASSSPRQLLDVLALKLHTTAMIRRSSKRYYEFEGKRMTVKQILLLARNDAGVPDIYCLSL